MLEFYRETSHVAAKEHKCDLCGWIINKGERYYRVASKYDGDFTDACQHTHCRNMIDEYCSKYNEPDYDRDNIQDFLANDYCCDCEASDDGNCDYSVFECPKLIKRFSDSKGGDTD